MLGTKGAALTGVDAFDAFRAGSVFPAAFAADTLGLAVLEIGALGILKTLPASAIVQIEAARELCRLAFELSGPLRYAAIGSE